MPWPLSSPTKATASGLLPHQFPFQLIDPPSSEVSGPTTVEARLAGTGAVARGAFPFAPMLTLEMLAQAAMVALADAEPVAVEPEGDDFAAGRVVPRKGYLVGLDAVRFSESLVEAPLLPGDVLQLRLEKVADYGRLLKVHGIVERGGEALAEADLMLAVEA